MKIQYRKMTGLLGILLILATVSTHAAVRCGMTVIENVVLDRDLYCENSDLGYALNVGIDDISIDLNGHHVFGNDLGIGIQAKGVKGFALIGNGGTISNFELGVELSDSSAASIKGVMFNKNLLAGISGQSTMNDIMDHQFYSNTFTYGEYGIKLGNGFGKLTGHESSGHKIMDNQFYRIDINIGLYFSANTEISNNFIWRAQRAGVVLVSSDHNHIHNNQILDSNSNAIEISNSSSNNISGNYFDGGVFGMFIVTSAYASGCTRADLSEFNQVTENYFYHFDWGVYLRTFSCGEVRTNQVTNNKIYDNDVGIYLSGAVRDNDLTGNGYVDTVTPIFDASDGNNDY